MFAILKHLKRKGHDVSLLLPSKGSFATKLEEEGIDYDIVPYYGGYLYLKPVIKHLLVPILGILNLFMFPIILLKIKKNNPDIIYSNSSLENIGFFASKILRKKHIQHVREFMSVDYNSFFIFGRRAKQRFFSLSDGVIFVSNSVKDYIQVNPDLKWNYKVIYNGIRIPYSALPPVNHEKNRLIFGLVGIFDEAKGQGLAVKYFSKIQKEYLNAELHLFGDKECSYKDKVLELINKLGLKDKVIIRGFVDNPKEIYDNIDILFMFSRSEGFGRVTAEAMAYGVPVVGFDNAGTSELIQDRRSGCLFSDFNSFKDSVCYLANSEENYNTIREAAFERVRTNFNEDIYVNKVEKFVIDVNDL
jgi:glycosyltransferase involved in cell wall biosynthesis